MTKYIENVITRRKMVISGALGLGSLTLKSLVTGLPVAFLAGHYNQAIAQAPSAKFLIISHRSNGDPITNNVPGTYAMNKDDSSDPLNRIQHPEAAELGEIANGWKDGERFELGQGNYVRAAPIWKNLPSDLRNRMAFWHQATNVNAHADFKSVKKLNGAIKNADGRGESELAEAMAQELFSDLGCVTRQPITLGGSTIEYDGRTVPPMRPLDVKELVSSQIDNIDEMMRYRDKFLDDTYRDLKTNGTPAQRRFMDMHANSKQEAATLEDRLGDLVVNIVSNDEIGQVQMAVALISLNISPVISIGLAFGQDNHGDPRLEREFSQSLSGIKAIEELWVQLKALNMQDKAVFTSLNTFGRKFMRSNMGAGGRNHNSHHHAMPIFGSNIKPGVVGGIIPHEGDFKAANIDSTSGAAAPNGDIQYEDLLVSSGKTLAKALGLSDEAIDRRFQGGKIISGALQYG